MKRYALLVQKATEIGGFELYIEGFYDSKEQAINKIQKIAQKHYNQGFEEMESNLHLILTREYENICFEIQEITLD